jgi:hypothetical protein
MRLLMLGQNGQFTLTKNFINNIPRYAILSHTWGDEDEEITFNDFVNNSGMAKSGTTGYEKIKFCGEQAGRDGLRHFWIDTCCIDKSNAVELQEAINSMFRWYRNATKCYVYLSDVSTNKNSQLSELPGESAFCRSRWFTRGWTLQELLAPISIEFFSQEGIRLGDKESLQLQIQQITGIPIGVLRGDPISQISIDTRVAWIANRETTKEEDLAYSLFGIFDVHLPLLYGESIINALRRLVEEIERSLSVSQHGKPPFRNLKHLIANL